MRESAMMSKSKRWAAEAPEDIQIGGLRRERQRSCSQRGLAVESSAAQARAGQEMSYRFQLV